MPLAAPSPAIGHHVLPVFSPEGALVLLLAVVLGRPAMGFRTPAVTGKLIAGVCAGASSRSRHGLSSPVGRCPNRQLR
ncbi:hypothetical protein [Streptomyces sp. KMM 9044]|uniref:hypothetical protein n=1 Tax=Streptomyces sp. KMM 9044 TaxID=2744474 RepID=UPI0021513268|nr:hypothetical protein [Streptomyces sp. KMM 9044]WAX81697.1 hypothetical protein HUV60_032980 [Streptomyces sp. KMM 9044]